MYFWGSAQKQNIRNDLFSAKFDPNREVYSSAQWTQILLKNI